ncbi:MAG: hypothetical protein IT204_20210 [Fimbriimonadaceae bacterium]|nr:hypothetical protein [Fimbriimonadaceae bacterium]
MNRLDRLAADLGAGVRRQATGSRRPAATAFAAQAQVDALAAAHGAAPVAGQALGPGDGTLFFMLDMSALDGADGLE